MLGITIFRLVGFGLHPLVSLGLENFVAGTLYSPGKCISFSSRVQGAASGFATKTLYLGLTTPAAFGFLHSKKLEFAYAFQGVDMDRDILQNCYWSELKALETAH